MGVATATVTSKAVLGSVEFAFATIELVVRVLRRWDAFIVSFELG